MKAFALTSLQVEVFVLAVHGLQAAVELAIEEKRGERRLLYPLLLLLSSSSAAATAVVPTTVLRAVGKAHKYEPQLVPTVAAVAVVEGIHFHHHSPPSKSLLAAYLVGSLVRSVFRLGPVPSWSPQEGCLQESSPPSEAFLLIHAREEKES